MKKERKERGNTESAVSRNNLVKGSVVNGHVQSEMDIRIDGTINGDLRCKARVVIGSQAIINGDIHCQNARIEGAVTGNILCKELLDICASAQIKGDISCHKLVLEDGAVFNGACKMTQNA